MVDAYDCGLEDGYLAQTRNQMNMDAMWESFPASERTVSRRNESTIQHNRALVLLSFYKKRHKGHPYKMLAAILKHTDLLEQIIEEYRRCPKLLRDPNRFAIRWVEKHKGDIGGALCRSRTRVIAINMHDETLQIERNHTEGRDFVLGTNLGRRVVDLGGLQEFGVGRHMQAEERAVTAATSRWSTRASAPSGSGAAPPPKKGRHSAFKQWLKVRLKGIPPTAGLPAGLRDEFNGLPDEEKAKYEEEAAARRDAETHPVASAAPGASSSSSAAREVVPQSSRAVEFANDSLCTQVRECWARPEEAKRLARADGVPKSGGGQEGSGTYPIVQRSRWPRGVGCELGGSGWVHLDHRQLFSGPVAGGAGG